MIGGFPGHEHTHPGGPPVISYTIEDCMSENDTGSLIGGAITLEEAVRIAEDYCKENIVEYGIRFNLDT